MQLEPGVTPSSPPSYSGSKNTKSVPGFANCCTSINWSPERNWPEAT